MGRRNELREGSARLEIALVAAVAVTLGVACGSDSDAEGGPDSSVLPDSGSPTGDAGPQDDAGPRPDGGPVADLVLCGEWEDRTAPAVIAASSGDTAAGQNAAYCGESFPTVDLSANDPFESIRYQTPADTLVPPFEACQDALRASLSSRPSCADVDGSTLLVSQAGDSDPRWQTGDFDGLYGTIQEAIDAAEHCDAIVVRPGVYQEYLVVDGKDVEIVSDTWNEAGTVEDGNDRVAYTAERIDLAHYYATGERVVTESRQTVMKPLKRATRTVLEGGGYAEGPTLGGAIDRDEENPDDPNRGCGNRRPMVDFKAGTTRNTIFDGFTVRLMPEQDHTIPGHGHTLQCRGGSPIIRNNIVYNNGSTGVGVHANFVVTSPVTPPCAYDPSLAQETFKNDDYRASNVAYRPAPLVYGNISYQNNGLGLGNNHYSCATMVGNETFWNAVPGEEDEHQSPGIGNRHGAKTLIDRNIVYENAWTGIAVRQGYLQPADDCAADPTSCNHIDERTQAVVTRNIVFDNGSESAPEDNRGGIAVDGAGLPGQPVSIRENVVYESKVSGIAVRNEYAGEDRGFVMDDTYVVATANTSFNNTLQGLTCRGSDYGTSHCAFVGNDTFWNHTAGIGFIDDAAGSALQNVSGCNTQSGIQTTEATGAEDIAIMNNIFWANVSAGIMDLGSLHDYNLVSANNGQAPTCSDDPQGNQCKYPQVGSQSGGAVGPNELFIDPEFVEPTSFDFGLGASSPAKDSGTDISSYYTGWPVAGAGPDRGSHEE